MTVTAADAGPASGSTPLTPPAAALGVLAGMVAAALTVALGVLIGTGAAGPPSGPLLFDPGAGVRYGLPVARVLHDLAAALTVGALGLATWLVGPDAGASPRALTGVRQVAMRVGTITVGIWLLASALTLVLTVADASGLSPSTPGFADLVASFATQVDLGRALLASLLLVAVAANLAVLATSVVASGWAAACAVVALLPLALTGHAAGSRDHMNSVDSLAVHLVGVVIWVGGLGAL
ncbi:MAG: hypothetical protein ACLGIF_05950, partial [Actinomycetes bacterium]